MLTVSQLREVSGFAALQVNSAADIKLVVDDVDVLEQYDRSVIAK